MSTIEQKTPSVPSGLDIDGKLRLAVKRRADRRATQDDMLRHLPATAKHLAESLAASGYAGRSFALGDNPETERVYTTYVAEWKTGRIGSRISHSQPVLQLTTRGDWDRVLFFHPSRPSKTWDLDAPTLLNVRGRDAPRDSVEPYLTLPYWENRFSTYRLANWAEMARFASDADDLLDLILSVEESNLGLVHGGVSLTRQVASRLPAAVQ